MNIIYFTQTSGIDVFFNLMQEMKKHIKLDKVGFYLAGSRYFNSYLKDNPSFEPDSYFLLKEWEIIKDSKNIQPDIELLKEYEKKIGNPYFWDAIVSDRRIYLGKKFAYAQDYKPRYNHDRMMAILQVGLQRIDSFFKEVQPQAVVSFQSVTLGDYLSYLFAKAYKIPLLNLRPTRIRNYFYAGDTILEPTEGIQKTQKNMGI